MALPFPIADTQTDAKSPIDAQLMDAYRLNQEYLDSQIGGAPAGGIIAFRVNGYLNRIKALLSQGAGNYLDGGVVSSAVTFTKASLYLEQVGTSGALEVDVKRHKELQHGIQSISSQYAAVTSAIGRLGTPQNTQAISLATPAIPCQSISRFKPTINIESIISLGNNEFMYVFTGAAPLDADYEEGDGISFSGCTNAANDGNYVITAVNYDSLPSVVVTNVSGAAQATAAGTGQLEMWEQVFTAAVDSNFVVGETFNSQNHTTPTYSIWNKRFIIHAVNQGGNNIIIKKFTNSLFPIVPETFLGGLDIGTPDGEAVVARLVYTFAAPVDDTMFIVGEKVLAQGHVAPPQHNGTPLIAAVNQGGNNIVVTTGAQAEQAGAGGTVDTLRWLYTLPSDPAGEFLVGDSVSFTGSSNANNDGTFTVQTVKRFGLDNIEIYNPNGVTQTFAQGNTENTKKIISFAEDFSSDYIVNTSQVALEGVLNQDTDGRTYEVLEINRGGFSNYNIVIDSVGVLINSLPQGRVAREVRTIFIERPRIEVDTALGPRFMQKDLTATFAAGFVEADTILSMDIIEIPDGLPSTMLLHLT